MARRTDLEAMAAWHDTLLAMNANVDLLRWRSRRGLVENDLYIERFFTHLRRTS